MQASDRNGPIVGAAQVADGDEIMLISDKGTLVRTRVDEVSIQGRNTQGVRLIRLKDSEKLVGLEAVQDPEQTLSAVNESDESPSRLERRESDGAGDGHE